MSDESTEFEENEPKKSGVFQLMAEWAFQSMSEQDFAELERMMLFDIDEMFGVSSKMDFVGRSPIGFVQSDEDMNIIDGVILPDDVLLLDAGIISTPGRIQDYDR